MKSFEEIVYALIVKVRQIGLLYSGVAVVWDVPDSYGKGW